LIITPGDKSNFSTIIGSLKRCFSRDVNNLLSISGGAGDILTGDDGEFYPGDDHDRRLWDRRPFYRRLEGIQYSFRLKREYETVPLKRYAEMFNQAKFPFRYFKWQKSFHHRVIFNDKQMHGYSNYIRNQPVKHGAKNARVWVDI